MRAVYEYRPDVDRCQTLVATAERTYERLRHIEARDVETWSPPRLRWLGRGPRGDFPNLAGHFPVVSHRALDVLMPLIEGAVDVLALGVPGGGYVGLHVRDVPDVLDVERSNVCWFEPGRAMLIEEYAFRESELPGHHLFRLPQLPLHSAYLSDTAYERVVAAGLEGLLPVKLWEVDQSPKRRRRT